MFKKVITTTLALSLSLPVFAQENKNCEGINALKCTAKKYAPHAATAATGATMIYYVTQSRALAKQLLTDVDVRPPTPNHAEIQILRQVQPKDDLTVVFRTADAVGTEQPAQMRSFKGTQTRDASSFIRSLYASGGEVHAVGRTRTAAQHAAFRRIVGFKAKGSIVVFGLTVAASYLSFSQNKAEANIQSLSVEILDREASEN